MHATVCKLYDATVAVKVKIVDNNKQALIIRWNYLILVFKIF